MYSYTKRISSVAILALALLSGCAANDDQAGDSSTPTDSASESVQAAPEQQKLEVESESDPYEAHSELLGEDAPKLEDWLKDHEDSPIGNGDVVLDDTATEARSWKIETPLEKGDKLHITVLCESPTSIETSIVEQSKFNLFTHKFTSCEPADSKTITLSAAEDSVKEWTFNAYPEDDSNIRVIITK